MTRRKNAAGKKKSPGPTEQQQQQSARPVPPASDTASSSKPLHVSFAPPKKGAERKVRNGGSRRNGPSTLDGDYYMPPSGRGLKPVPSLNSLNRIEREKFVLHKKPLMTVYYAFRELFIKFGNCIRELRKRWRAVLSLILLSTLFYCALLLPGKHQIVVEYLKKKLLTSAYWCGLGILSSVGLGTGLHTFLLYLGPHIASVTLAAYECESLDFPEPPFPDQIVCPNSTTTSVVSGVVSLWAIMSKVRLEAFAWGAGTALGELPPYFMARTARISGEEPDDEEYREYVQFLGQMREFEGRLEEESWLDRAKVAVEKLVERVGFLGILLCASIPNPLFDLAGLTCGHFGVSFWTFFGATFIGKAVIKMHIQKLFVILTFSERHVEKLVSAIKYIPKVGPSLQAPFKEYLSHQKQKLHGQKIPTKTSWLPVVFEALIFVMVAYFVMSIVNSLAQSYHKRLCRQTFAPKAQ